MHSRKWMIFTAVWGMLAAAGCGDDGGATGTDGGAAKLVIGVQPQAGAFAAPLAVQPVVEVRDARGNRVATPVEVTASVAGGGLEGTLTRATVDGVATFTDLSLAGPAGPRTLTFSAPGADAVTAQVTLGAPPRAETDRPDDIAGPQVRVLYVLPSDGVDRALDTEARIAYSVGSFQNWLRVQTSGRSLRMDAWRGALDVGFFRLARTDAEMMSFGVYVKTVIESDLARAGQLSPDKKYLVYYDGGSLHACGGASWPPNSPGRLAAMYLRGTPGGVPVEHGCGATPLASSPTAFPGYWEFAALHDALHTLGIVSRQAPNHADAYPAHVPEPSDLMYTGPEGWRLDETTTVDVGDDDYAGTHVPDALPNLLKSPYFAQAEAFDAPADPAAAFSTAPVRIVDAPPPHPPFAAEP